jgi:hypothetical protein
VSQAYLVDALSYAEAENRILEEMSFFVEDNLKIINISPYRLQEMFLSDDFDRYYRVKVKFITLNEISGREKETPANMLVGAKTAEEAVKTVKDGMKGSLCDYEIASVTETNIVDVYPYKEKEDAV